MYAASGTLTLTNDTIAWNFLEAYTDSGEQPGQGTGVYNASATLNMVNTIIALDQLFSNSQSTMATQVSDLAGPGASSTVASSDHDFIGDGSASNLTNGTNDDQVGNDGSPLNPQFVGPTVTNRGLSGQEVAFAYPSSLTQTFLLAPSSTASGAGDTSAASTIAAAEGVTNATDQNGLSRLIAGKIDIGSTQGGVQLTGSAPATVTAGNNITYTLTLTDNGPNTLTSVTLSDPLPANTTFVSVTTPSGWTASTPAVGQTGTVSFSIASLAPATTTTFTVVVQVPANTAGGTSITNTPTISYTGAASPASNSVAFITMVPGQSTTNISNQVGFIPSPIIPDPFLGANDYIGAALLINNSGTTFAGPVALVLTGLPAGVTLLHASGTYNGSPYINIVPPNGSWKPGLLNFIIAALEFNDPSHAKISYTAEIVQGI